MDSADSPLEWRQFTNDLLEELDPRRMLESRLALSAEGFETGDLKRSWREFGSIHVLAAGKPAVAQATALMSLLRRYEDARSRLTRALVITRDGYGSPSEDVEVFYSSHPVPNACSLEAVGPWDLAIFLVSGGSSALVESLVEPYTLEDLRRLMPRSLYPQPGEL